MLNYDVRSNQNTRMSTDTSSPGNNPPSDGGGNAGDESNGTYECNICLETANDAVVSMCGHLFW